MPRANPVLTIWVAAQWAQHPEICALRQLGHAIVDMLPGTTAWTHDAPDLILHPAAHAWDDALWPYLEAALRRARERARARKKGQRI